MGLHRLDHRHFPFLRAILPAVAAFREKASHAAAHTGDLDHHHEDAGCILDSRTGLSAAGTGSLLDRCGRANRCWRHLAGLFRLEPEGPAAAGVPRSSRHLFPAAKSSRTRTLTMEHTVHHSPNGAGHEESEVSVRLIVVSLAFLAVATAIVFVLVVGIFRYFYASYSTEEATRLSQPVVPPEPRIEVAPYEQLQQLRVKEDHILNSYAYVDKQTGVVRVPIDRAIDMLAAKGLPSHNYLDDILAGRKPPAAPAQPAAKQGSNDAK